MISRMQNSKCPWCNEVFEKVGDKLVGIDQTPRRGERVLWFHAKCNKEWQNSKEFDVGFDGENFVKVPKGQRIEGVEMNQSAKETCELAVKLGGQDFLNFMITVQSRAMTDIIFPVIAELSQSISDDDLTKVSRALDKAFLIGVFEVWNKGRH